MAEDGGVSIRNCRFAYKCSRNWNGLRLTAVPGERFCGECNRTVYFCETHSHLTEAIRLDRCVAILDEVMHNGSCNYSQEPRFRIFGGRDSTDDAALHHVAEEFDLQRCYQR